MTCIMKTFIKVRVELRGYDFRARLPQTIDFGR
jgi:hypothetical protein